MPAQFFLGIDLKGQRAQNGASPTSGTDLANKDYVDQVAQGVNDIKDPVRVATTAAITLSGTQTIDGVAVAAGDRVLVKNQAAGADNGIYVVAAGAWARSTDADATGEVTRGMATTVLEGTNKGTSGAQTNPITYVLTTANPITLGTTALTFSPIGGTGGTAKAAGSGLTEDASNYNVGAGTGISVTADAVAVDTSVVVRKVMANSAAATSTTVTHNFGHRDVQVQVWEGATPWAQVFPDITLPDTNSAVVNFGSSVTAGQYRIVVQG